MAGGALMVAVERGEREGEGPFRIEQVGLGEAKGRDRESMAYRSSSSSYGW
jgi:hypothetical protein